MRLLALLALPFAVSVALAVLVVEVSQGRPPGVPPRAGLERARHRGADHQGADRKEAIAAVEPGPAATERALAELAAAREESLALAASFAPDELAEEEALAVALDALAAAGPARLLPTRALRRAPGLAQRLPRSRRRPD